MTDFPTRTNSDPNSIFLGVGRIMSIWEGCEYSLSLLYSGFVGFPDGEAISQYGSGAIFRERLRVLSRAADNYFVSHCHQDLEARFYDIYRRSLKFASNRNEVAHGIVVDVSSMEELCGVLKITEKSKENFLLIPPLYIGKKHQHNGLPLFAYSSFELANLASSMIALVNDLRCFQADIFGVPNWAKESGWP